MNLESTVPAPPQVEIWTVSQLTRRVKGILESEIGEIWVTGEISNWRVSPAGHCYFTLKDDRCQLSAVMFGGRRNRLRFEPDSGLEVVVRGLISVYEQRGQYQIICEEMHPKGMGALQLAFEKLKAKLAEEGLFNEEHKKPLPLLPGKIGIVTSPTGAAIRDILNVLDRRFARVHVLLYPARVQGDDAVDEIVAGIRALDTLAVDVIIIGRGGGSLEDLWAFNEEAVVRAVFEAQTPIISAVGHEIDFALSDFAADLRAPTPSAAAELVVKEYEALCEAVRGFRSRLAAALTWHVERMRNRLDRVQQSFVFRRPEELVRQLRQQCDELRAGLESAANLHAEALRHRITAARRSLVLLSPANQLTQSAERLAAVRRRLIGAGVVAVERKRTRFVRTLGQLNALSPLAILSRGYAVAWKLPEENLVRSAEELRSDDRLRLRFGKGQAIVSVDTVQTDSS